MRVRNLDGKVIAMQCKGRNGSSANWTINKLKKENILRYVFFQIEHTDAIEFQFISACPVLQLNDLTAFIKNLDFANAQKQLDGIQARGLETRKAFFECCSAYNLYHDNIDIVYDSTMVKNLPQFFRALSSITSILYVDDSQSKADLIDCIKQVFYGDAESIYALLADYAIEQNRLDQWIVTTEICSFLENHGYCRRDFHNVECIYSRIKDINRLFIASFQPINDRILPFIETQPILNALFDGKSVIVHGDSGSGKTGVLVRLINELEQIGICCLAIDMHHYRPNSSSTVQYGEQLGFISSLEICIDKITKDSRGVLIIDQLDSIRWTNSGFLVAQDICTLLLHRISQINQDRKYPISVVIACRTFDLQNDPTIKKLIDRPRTDHSSRTSLLTWERHEVLPMPEEYVNGIIGDAINILQPKQIQVLRNPRSLYIWTKLIDINSPFSSFYDLQSNWWKQILDEKRPHELSREDTLEAVKVLVHEFSHNGNKAIKLRLLQINSEVVKYLCSAGIVTYFENDQIGFSHQSVLDFFFARQIISAIRSGCKLSDVILERGRQTPLFRYQMQTVLEVLLHDDIKAFLDTATYIMSSNARFFIKQLVFLVIGTCDTSDTNILNFILQYQINPEYTNCLMKAFQGDKTRIEYLVSCGALLSWARGEDQWRNVVSNLLTSINDQTSSIIDSFLKLIYNEQLYDAFRLYYKVQLLNYDIQKAI